MNARRWVRAWAEISICYIGFAAWYGWHQYVAVKVYVDFLCRHGAVCAQGDDLTKWFYDLELAAVWALAPPVALFVLGFVVYVILKAAREGRSKHVST